MAVISPISPAEFVWSYTHTPMPTLYSTLPIWDSAAPCQISRKSRVQSPPAAFALSFFSMASAPFRPSPGPGGGSVLLHPVADQAEPDRLGAGAGGLVFLQKIPDLPPQRVGLLPGQEDRAV